MFVALGINHGKRMRPITLSSATCTALPYFSALSHKWHIFGQKLLNMKIVFRFFSTIFVQNISHFMTNSERYYHKRAQIFT